MINAATQTRKYDEEEEEKGGVRPPLHWKATIHASALVEKFNSKTM